MPFSIKYYLKSIILDNAKVNAFFVMVRAAALRFWLSRLLTQEHQQHPDADAISKDLMQFYSLLLEVSVM